MRFLSSLLAWANVPFVMALGIAVLFGILQATGLLGLLAGGGDHDADADHDGGADADADHDGSVDADGDADADADADGDTDADGDAEGNHEGGAHHAGAAASAGAGVLVGLGVGTVPLSIVWQTFAVGFGFAGIAANTFYVANAPDLPVHTLVWTLPIGLVFGAVLTRLVAKTLRRVLTPGAGATSRKDLIGLTAIVVSSKVDGEIGEVRFADKSGHKLWIPVRTMSGQAPISEGDEVVFVDYNADRNMLFVAPLEEPAPKKKHRIRTAAAPSKGAVEETTSEAKQNAGEEVATEDEEAGSAAQKKHIA